MSDKTPALTATTTSTSTNEGNNTVTTANYRLPSDITLQHSSKLAIVEDKPIMLDYWTQSLEKKVLVGVRESGEKLLVKSAEEYTSAIAKFYKSATEYIVVTENSIYIVSSDIPTRRIS
jgi:predicted nuclease of restriction endonuclease-like RecB superfamily